MTVNENSYKKSVGIVTQTKEAKHQKVSKNYDN
jgi:hypothetical protein